MGEKKYSSIQESLFINKIEKEKKNKFYYIIIYILNI